MPIAYLPQPGGNETVLEVVTLKTWFISSNRTIKNILHKDQLQIIS